MSQELPVDGFKWKKHILMRHFIKNYDEDSGKGYILEVDVECPKHLQLGNISHYDLPFWPQQIKINKIEKLVCNLYDKKTMWFI